MVGRTLEDVGKAQFFFLKRPSRAPKMEITNTGAINGSGNDFMDNLYGPRLSMYGN
jgi:hypothetical protein